MLMHGWEWRSRWEPLLADFILFGDNLEQLKAVATLLY
jgi:hypothetical protein